ncbi:hypothetical protein [Enterovirga sp.]|jgi:hypothetical protein|uniref:hypothetical protein n=1 Tax=Enterovirga sp. TaxID=2026350 RepID=UPI00262438FF|nr:hypothetical protein [Enterovirga sp.]MDB5592018.1 hypothetical protein [Enterovirga sp.]
MPKALRMLLLAAGPALLGGCAYMPVPADPIRYVTSPADVAVCRRLGSTGFTRTDGVGPFSYSDITVVVPNEGQRGRPIRPGLAHALAGHEILGPNFAVRLNVMRDAALGLGASDLFLRRRLYRDYSYVEGVAYRCPR